MKIILAEIDVGLMKIILSKLEGGLMKINFA